jgi:HEAT repeat protein/Na+/melibiose symporter-like transporter
MNTEPTNVEKLRGLPWDIAFSAANSVFSQFTFFGSVFILFLSELGLSKTQIGSLLSLLPFSGLIALFVAPAAARFGYKRTFLVSWGARTVATAFILLTPAVRSLFGLHVMLLYVIGIVAIFAICRAVGMTARLPWVQEFVPDTVRGKFSALSNVFAQLTGFLTVMVAGYIVERSTGLSGFMLLFAAGVLFGLISVWAASSVPGGAPTPGTQAQRDSFRDEIAALRDGNFVRFLVGVGLIILASGPLASFLPLFMQEEVGLSTGNVVWLQNGTLLGGLLSSYLWGWLADRYGSKPVMMSGISLQVLLPLFWLLMPRQSDWSLNVALGIAVLQGLASIGWQIGSMRLRFVSVVPAEKKRDYMALYFAWIGIVGGIGQLVGGWLLDASKGIAGKFLIFTLDSYTILFLVSLVLPVLAGLLLRSVRADSAVSTGEFAAMFFRGNPFMAMESLIRYHRARDERAAVSMTERLGRTQSPLTVDELLEALSDPRFYVRFEAIVSIARRGPDARLMAALIKVLEGGEPALSTVAAWALGRIGDERAIGPLREGLDARYRSVQAHCARSLGSLGDEEILPVLLQRLENETDTGLRMAYAAALGKLGAQEATKDVLSSLYATPDTESRGELALAVARIVGDEHHFIQLLRQTQADTGTAASQAIAGLKKTITEYQIDSCDLLVALDDCEDALARDDLERGVALISRVIRCLPVDEFAAAPSRILRECAARLDEFGADRIEYVLLALHTMAVELAQAQPTALARMFG